MQKPELLAPAGSLEKCETAFRYGADAIYCAGQRYGLRTAAENFTEDELRRGVRLAKKLNKKVYVVLNAFLHDEDWEGLEDFLTFLAELKIDAVIVSDLGVASTVKRFSDLPLHLSTQASCLNLEAAKIWKDLGFSRIVFGREVPLSAAGEIAKKVGIEAEVFVHGAMCSAFSGHCVISNFTSGRDSNRGGCAQSCRFQYSLNESGEKGTFLSSKDLLGLQYIPDFFAHNIHSLKIEGRMKGLFYLASTTKIYREAIDSYSKGPEIFAKNLPSWLEEMQTIPHRGYTAASLHTPATQESLNLEFDEHRDQRPYLGKVLHVDAHNYAYVQVKNGWKQGEKIATISFQGPALTWDCEALFSAENKRLEESVTNQIVKVPCPIGVSPQQILRRVH